MTLATVMRHLRNLHGVRTVLCEGGPTIFGALLQEDLVDELFLTLAPKLAGGGRGPTISSGPQLATPAKLPGLGLGRATRCTFGTPCTEPRDDPRLPLPRL